MSLLLQLTMAATLPTEFTTLRELASTLQGALAELKIENQLLRQKLEFFINRYFGGTKSESLDPNQLELRLAGLAALSASAVVAEKPVAPRASVVARRTRPPLPANLETERVVLEPAEVQQ